MSNGTKVMVFILLGFFALLIFAPEIGWTVLERLGAAILVFFETLVGGSK